MLARTRAGILKVGRRGYRFDEVGVMGLEDQTLAEFAVLTVGGAVWLAFTAALVTNYRGFATRVAHGNWRYYQRRWVQRLFLWTRAMRARYADEAWIRRNLLITARIGLAVGVFVLMIELLALVTGHVA
jgi:hypothetical protein